MQEYKIGQIREYLPKIKTVRCIDKPTGKTLMIPVELFYFKIRLKRLIIYLQDEKGKITKVKPKIPKPVGQTEMKLF